MSEEKYDNKGRLIYWKNLEGLEFWKEYDKNNHCIHFKDSNGLEYWQEFDENNNLIHYKSSDDYEYWYRYNDSGEKIEITEKEYNDIEFRKKEKEYNSRTKCSRFEIMEI